MTYPLIEINLQKIKHNAEIVTNACKQKGIEVVGVTKVSGGSIEIAQAMIDAGIKILGDSKIDNLKKYKDLDAKKMLLRLPMISEVKDLITNAHISLNSEIKTIKAIAKECKRLGIVHEIILIYVKGFLMRKK